MQFETFSLIVLQNARDDARSDANCTVYDNRRLLKPFGRFGSFLLIYVVVYYYVRIDCFRVATRPLQLLKLVNAQP